METFYLKPKTRFRGYDEIKTLALPSPDGRGIDVIHYRVSPALPACRLLAYQQARTAELRRIYKKICPMESVIRWLWYP